jgi:hypothetical protein
MAMTNTQPPDQASAGENLAKAAALAVIMIWMLALLFFLASRLAYSATGSPYGRQWATLYSVVVLFISTPLVLLFSVPILIKYYPRQPRSPEPATHDVTEPRIDWIRHAVTESQTPDRTKSDTQTKSDAQL